MEQLHSASTKGKLARIATNLRSSQLARTAIAPVKIAQHALQDARYARSADARYIRSLESMYVGQRCFIVGNGPSLRIEDLEAISSDVSFGANKISNVFDKTSWRPTFYLAFDREFMMQEGELFSQLDLDHLFLDWTSSTKRLQRTNPNVTLMNVRTARFSTKRYTTENIVFSRRPDQFIGTGHTVTFIALQLAMWMGFSNIYLIGMDHTYTHIVDSNGTVHITDGVSNHCFKDSGAYFNPFFLEGVEYAYNLAREEGERRGQHIYNATRGGALEVFERVDMDDALKGSNKGVNYD